MSAENIVVAPILIPLVTAIITLIARKWQTVQQGVSVAGMAGYVVSVAVLAYTVLPGTVLSYQLSAWPAPYGITLVADALSVFILLLTAIVSGGVLLYALSHIDAFGQQVAYHPLFAFMLVGVSGAFLTADIFNMFVWFEVMLMSSYILVVLYSDRGQTRAALQYVVLNIIGSVIMLLAIGGLYATTGTLNMADLAVRLADPAAYNIQMRPVLGLSTLLFAVFALKAGIVPFQFWVPRTYSAAPAPVAAMLAGVTKKVGIYAIIRLYFTVFAAAALPDSGVVSVLSGSTVLAFFGPVLFLMAMASIVIGGLGAVSRDTVDELLAYSSISQVGFIVLPLTVAATVPGIRTLAVTATLIYALNHAVAKSMLFLVTGTLYQSTGSTKFADLSGLAETTPVLAAAFFIGALSLIGVPPAMGFFGKLLIFNAMTQSIAFGALAVAVTGSLLTIVYVSYAWNSVFCGDPLEMELVPVSRVQGGVVALLAGILILLGLWFELVFTVAHAAAETVVQTDPYIDTVLRGATQ
jgi:multicomponent Na+:H+ antiporter subunit D